MRGNRESHATHHPLLGHWRSYRRWSQRPRSRCYHSARGRGRSWCMGQACRPCNQPRIAAVHRSSSCLRARTCGCRCRRWWSQYRWASPRLLLSCIIYCSYWQTYILRVLDEHSVACDAKRHIFELTRHAFHDAAPHCKLLSMSIYNITYSPVAVVLCSGRIVLEINLEECDHQWLGALKVPSVLDRPQASESNAVRS